MSDQSTDLNVLDPSESANVLSSDGPVVKCVLLKARRTPENGNRTTSEDSVLDSKPAASPMNGQIIMASAPSVNDDDDGKGANLTSRTILKDHMEEIQLDSTPAKNMVSKILGGPSTFLGQYEDEGILLMIRKLPIDVEPEELPDLELSLLRDLCKDRDINTENMLEKTDLINALTEWSRRNDPPFNPHRLQPPLHNKKVRGDILVLKVADSKEYLDGEESPKQMKVPPNENFFSDYTLDEYVRFASRTDIPEYEVNTEDYDEGSADEEDDDSDNDDSHDGEEEKQQENSQGLTMSNADGDTADEEGLPIRFGDEEEIDEEDKAAMFNLVMNEVLRQYREEHGRGPDTKELLEMRATIAKELDVQVAEVDAAQADWNIHAKLGTPAKDTAKTINFSEEDRVLEYEPDPNEHDPHEYEEDTDDEHDYEGEPTEYDDGDGAREPAKKKLKMEHPALERSEEEDSKPAAVAPAEAAESAVLMAEGSQGKFSNEDSGRITSSCSKREEQ